MLDIKKIRENGKQLDEALASRKHEASSSLIIEGSRLYFLIILFIIVKLILWIFILKWFLKPLFGKRL